MNEIEKKIHEVPVCCPMCETGNVITELEMETFEYGVGEKLVLLNAYIPVSQCISCGYEFVGEKADEIRHDTISKHLKLLTSSDIKEIRIKLGLSQKSFAELSQLGWATIQRWEARQVLQSKSNDIYLRLLEFPENVERIRRFNNGQDMEQKNIHKPSKFQGKGLDNNAVITHISASQNFSLQRGVG